MKPLHSSQILVVGAARNCASVVGKEIANLEAAFSDAARLCFFVVESDSDDETLETLESLSREKSNFRYVSLGHLRCRYPKRTERIAVCRNRYLLAIKREVDYASSDYVVVADLDGANSFVSRDAVVSCWTRCDWDVCAANQLGPYYDIWALRHKLWSPNDCWEQSKFLQGFGIQEFWATLASVSARMITIPPSSSWIEVDSAFGGLAIYRRRAIEGALYRGVSGSGSEVCEHVHFHGEIRSRGGKIFINPALINGGISEHVIDFSYARLILLWLRSAAKRVLRRVLFWSRGQNVRLFR